MRHCLIAAALLLATSILPAVAQDGESQFRAASLTSGHPEAVDFAFERYDLGDAGQARLETGVENLEVFIGPVEQENKTLAWTTVLREDTLNAFQYGHILPTDSAGTITLSLDYGETELTLEARYLPESNIILYRWPQEVAAEESAAAPQSRNLLVRDGQSFPSLEVTTISDRKLDLASLEGKPLVLNWWHTTCAPCIIEMPGFNELAEQYGERVSFVAVTDDERENVRSFLSARPFDFQQTFVDSATGAALFGTGYPTTVILDAVGSVVHVVRGGSVNTAGEVEPVLERLLNGNDE